ncbi:MAG: pantoate--beta-alanine ligase, partial [Kiritimatiellae bacterium]|nr:pantoate--beta-alanine ligase [Kiritimatiellia bacterium]
SADERRRALGLSRALHAAAACVGDGGAAAAVVRARMAEVLDEHALQIEYAEVVDAESLEPVAEARRGNVALIAAYCGRTRLIDNRIL